MPEPVPAPLFTDGQRRLLGFTTALFALVGCGALIVFLLVMMGKVIGYFSHVLWPLAVAGILALVLRPLVDIIEIRFAGRRTLAVVTLYLVFVGFVTGVLFLIIPPLASQILDLIAYVPQLWENALRYTKDYYPQWVVMFDRLMANATIAAVVESVRDQAGKIPAMVIPSLLVLKHGTWAVVNFLANLAIVPIYLFFFLLLKGDFSKRLPEHLPFLGESVRNDVVFLVREFVSLVVSFFRGQLVIGLIMGAMYATGFTLVGLRFGLFIGLLLGVLNIVPYLGTIIGLLITIPLALLQEGGGMQLVGLIIVVKILVQTIEGWILTPKIMGDRTGLHPVTIIVAVFFWGTAFHGILGMILAIPLTAFFVTAWRLVKYKYFPRVEPTRPTVVSMAGH